MSKVVDEIKLRLNLEMEPSGEGNKNNCQCGGACQFGGNVAKANLLQGSRRITYDGKDTLVVPVIMIRSDVVMNGALVPNEELFAGAWNGVPVTINHPGIHDGFTANKPEVMEKMCVGTIFNAQVKRGILRAEAYIDIKKANALMPGLVDRLESGKPMDVSTGYYSTDYPEHGNSNGRDYGEVSRELKPDHLALLPNDTGACSYEDGCGVRANQRKASMADDKPAEEGKIKKAVENFLRSLGIPSLNARGSDDDWRQITADLIASDASPFTPDDMDALRMLSYPTLVYLRDEYLGDNDDPPATETSNKEATDVGHENKDGSAMSAADITKLVTDTVSTAMTAALEPVTNALKTLTDKAAAPVLTDDQNEALATAAKINADHRAGLISKITSNSDMKEEVIKDWPTNQLEAVANGIRVQTPDYSGRGAFAFAANADEGEPDEAEQARLEAMVPKGTKNALKELHNNGKVVN